MTPIRTSNTAPGWGAPVVPIMPSHTSGQSNVASNTAGTGKSVLANNVARQVTFSNNTGTTVEVFQDAQAIGFPVFDQTYYTFYGLINTSQLQVRRVDQSNTAVSIVYRWEGG